jgi:hypothetical protein
MNEEPAIELAARVGYRAFVAIFVLKLVFDENRRSEFC